MERRKVLYLIDKLELAGAQRHLIALLKRMDRSRYEPTVACLMQEGSLAEEVRALGVPVMALGVKRIYGLSGVLGLVKLTWLLKRERIDILHSFMFSENILGAMAAHWAETPMVITCRRDTGILSEGKPRHFFAYRLTNRWVDRILCVSEAIRSLVIRTERTLEAKVLTIPNGAQIEASVSAKKKAEERNRLGVAKDALIVAIVANLSWVKDHETFFKAAQRVKREQPNVRFWVIGEGALRKKLEKQVASLKLQQEVRFFGRVADPKPLLSLADISVNASVSEGMSNTILESMALGIPVVATDVDGNPETVSDGKTGLLVPPKNPEAMAQALLRLLRDSSLRAQMGEAGRDRIRQSLSLERMVQANEALYEAFFKPRVQFIFSKFPCYDETFILREMRCLKTAGVGLSIFSIKRGRDPVIHGDAVALMEHTWYIPFISPGVVWAQLYFIFRRPRLYLSTLFYVLAKNARSWDFLLKSMALFPKSAALARDLKRRRIYHLHAEWATHPATCALIASHLSGIPFSFTGHAHDIYRNTTMLAEKLEEASFVVTCTEENKRHLLSLDPRLSPSKILANYHGVDLHRFQRNSSASNGKLSLLSVGSLLRSKGFDILIKACRGLKEENLPFECTIIGGGPLEKELRQQVKRLGLDDSVKMLGYMKQEDMVPYYQKADLFALPVRLDQHWGIPNVLLEAMAAGAPVVCTKLPAIRELVEDGVNGLLVDEKNASALCDALVRLMRDERLRRGMSQVALKTVSEKFNAEKNAMNLVRLFEARRPA